MDYYEMLCLFVAQCREEWSQDNSLEDWYLFNTEAPEESVLSFQTLKDEFDEGIDTADYYYEDEHSDDWED